MSVLNPKKLSAWVTAIVMIIAVAAISEIFVYIPSATLGAVIIVSASSLFKSEEWKRFWKLSKRDFIPFIVRASRTIFLSEYRDLSPDKVTFGFALRKSSLGLILGIFTHLILLLARFTKPLNKEDKRVMKLEGRIMFPSADVSRT